VRNKERKKGGGRRYRFNPRSGFLQVYERYCLDPEVLAMIGEVLQWPHIKASYVIINN